MRVESDHRAAVGVGLAGCPRGRDRVVERFLRGALEPHVDRQPERVPGLGKHPALDRARRATERVDGELVGSIRAAQVSVVGLLDPGLAHHILGLIVVLLGRLELGGGDRADVAEHLCEQRLVGVAAQVGVGELHAGELDRVLLEVVLLILVDAATQHDRGQRVVRVRLDLREDLPDGDVRHHRELCELVRARRTALRQIGRPDLEAGPDHARDERMAVAVDDVRRAARRPGSSARGSGSPGRCTSFLRAPGAPRAAGTARRRPRGRRTRGSRRGAQAAASADRAPRPVGRRAGSGGVSGRYPRSLTSCTRSKTSTGGNTFRIRL